MIIRLDDARRDALFDYLARSEDAEALAGGGYACDVFDVEPPVSMELYPADGGADVAAAFALEYSDELGGYYLGEKLEDPAALLERLRGWAAIGGPGAP